MYHLHDSTTMLPVKLASNDELSAVPYQKEDADMFIQPSFLSDSSPLKGFMHQLLSEKRPEVRSATMATTSSITEKDAPKSLMKSQSCVDLNKHEEHDQDEQQKAVVVVHDNAKLPVGSHLCLCGHSHGAGTAAQRRFSDGNEHYYAPAAPFDREASMKELKRERRWSSFNEHNPRTAGLVRPRRRQSEDFMNIDTTSRSRFPNHDDMNTMVKTSDECLQRRNSSHFSLPPIPRKPSDEFLEGLDVIEMAIHSSVTSTDDDSFKPSVQHTSSTIDQSDKANSLTSLPPLRVRREVKSFPKPNGRYCRKTSV